MIADEDVPLARDQLLIVPAHLDAQNEKQYCRLIRLLMSTYHKMSMILRQTRAAYKPKHKGTEAGSEIDTRIVPHMGSLSTVRRDTIARP